MGYINNLPSKGQIFEYWRKHLCSMGFLIDWGEPSCWACGFHYQDKYDIKNPDARWDKILNCWENIPLQRCHIIPRSLGGTNDVTNLFLMCRQCHDLAPNTDIPEIFFEWAKAQSCLKRDSLNIQNAFEAFGIKENEYNIIHEIIVSKEFQSWIKGKFGLHRPQSNYAPISSRFTPSTMIGLAVHYRRFKSG